MSMNSVVELKPFKTMWKIKVKVIRLWKQYSAAAGETIEMVLCDIKGGKIHASVKKQLVYQFDRFLRQGCSLMLINFLVTHSCGSYRTTNHAYRISFLSTTRVRPSEVLPESLSGFEPVKYTEVLDGTLNPNYLVDIIGQVVEISQIDHVNVNGKETEKISLEMRNSDDERLPLVLWGKFACDVNEAMQVGDNHSTVLVLRFGKIKVWKEERSVSNAYNVSEIHLNPPMIEVGEFIASLPKDVLPLASVVSKQSSIVNRMSDKDDFPFHTPRKTIAQILLTKQVEKCVLLCTITAIDSDMGWFYLSCKVCSKKVLSALTSTNDDEEDDFKHTYYCETCKTYNPLTIPRYKLHLVVLDNTSNTKLLVFDNHAIQLLNQTCSQIVGPSNKFEIEEINVLPPALNSIIGKTFLFKIQIERENFVYKHDTYKVLNVITNKDLISDFEDSNSPNASEKGEFHDMDTQSDAPEASLAMQGSYSEQSESFDLTPAKRIRVANVDFGKSLDENSVTRSVNSVKIKQEKFEKSG